MTPERCGQIADRLERWEPAESERSPDRHVATTPVGRSGYGSSAAVATLRRSSNPATSDRDDSPCGGSGDGRSPRRGVRRSGGRRSGRRRHWLHGSTSSSISCNPSRSAHLRAPSGLKSGPTTGATEPSKREAASATARSLASIRNPDAAASRASASTAATSATRRSSLFG